MRLTLAAVLMLTACTPSGASTASPLTPGVTLASCRLPVSAGSPAKVGWLAVPGGTFTPDPTSVGHLGPDSEVAWDPAISGWVPTDPDHVSPDGARYVAPITSATIDVVDARTKSITAAISAQQQSGLSVFDVLGYVPTAIFLGSAGKNPEPGVWKIDTTSWKLSQVTSKSPGIPWSLVDGSIVWGTRETTTGATVIERLDSSTGVVQDVGAPSQVPVAIAGLAGSGVLVVNSGGPLTSAAVVDSDGSSRQVEVPPAISDLGPFRSLQDGPESLFASRAGLVAFDRNRGFRVVVPRPDLFRILGRCAMA